MPRDLTPSPHRPAWTTPISHVLSTVAIAAGFAVCVHGGAQRNTAHWVHRRSGPAKPVTQAKIRKTPFLQAERMRESLEGQPEAQRTRGDYARVLEAYRAIYHGNPADAKADAAVIAVAELLAEEGRLFQDQKALNDALGQYEFLRREYPHSRFRANALMTEGEIFRQDLHDPANARAQFQQLLKLYPQSPVAPQARAALEEIHQQELAARHGRSGKVTASAATPLPPIRKGSLKPRLDPAAVTEPDVDPAMEANMVHIDPETEAEIKKGVEPKPQALSAAALNAAPPPRTGKLPLVTGIRHWSTPVYTRIAIDLDDQVKYEASRVPNPDRIYFDLHGTKVAPELIGKSLTVKDNGFLKHIRVAPLAGNVTRIALDVSPVSEYTAFFLPSPARLIIDIHGRAPGHATTQMAVAQQRSKAAADTPAPRPPAEIPPQPNPGKDRAVQKSTSLNDLNALSEQPHQQRATSHPTTAPVVASFDGPASGVSTPPDEVITADVPAQPASAKAAARRNATGSPQPAFPAPAATQPTRQPQPQTPVSTATRNIPSVSPRTPSGSRNFPVAAPDPTATGQRSMARALGLKIGRIVVDAGHGGHDSGTLGPEGLQEKDIVLDVALRLGKLLKQRLGADVIYTRDDDTFIPLETRTAIANKAQADLFVSVHGNSSRDPSARGVETYYLNFTSSPDALEVAGRENAVSEKSIHELSDLVKKITLGDKIAESQEFASDVQQSLYNGLTSGNAGLKNRGVKKAPFVVLIGANMPSILAEISFITNPDDARELRQPEYRERIAESLYTGVARYVRGLNGIRDIQSDDRRTSR